jgi:hypothetical protein
MRVRSVAIRKLKVNLIAVTAVRNMSMTLHLVKRQ